MRQLKRFLAAIAMAATAAVGLIFAACASQEIVITLETYDDQTLTLTGAQGEAAVLPDDVTREGYFFDGWYASADYTGDPVTSTVFETDTTYYAKWTQGYAITLDPDDGTLADGQSTVIWLREGDNIAAAVAAYVPVRGENVFAGWYGEDGAPISSDAAMPAQALTLTAKYGAGYTVNVYLQDVDGAGYTLQENYASGTALIGSAFVPEVTVNGFTYAATAGDVTSLTIGEDASSNVYVMHFDRARYTVTYIETQPNGTVVASSQQSYLFGAQVDLPDNGAQYEGYRFFGWATRPVASCTEAVDELYTVNGNVSLYTVWNRGFTDLFNGEDLIFRNYDADNTAVLVRGGIDIPGSYVSATGFYRFRGSDGFALSALLNEENGTFIFYTTELQGNYYLYRDGSVDTGTYLGFYPTPDAINAVTYRAAGAAAVNGSYSISEDGYYVAEFSDGTTFSFLLGTAGGQPVFRIRGDEYRYGALAQKAEDFPIITLDGFGNATLETESGESSYTYTIEEDVVTLSSLSGVYATVRIMEYDGVYGYELYNADLDQMYTGAGVLTLDGCSNATFSSASLNYTGKYTAAVSQLGGYLVTVTTASATYYYRVFGLYLNAEMPLGYSYEALSADYAEYVQYTQEGAAGTLLLVADGETATLYENTQGYLNPNGGTSLKAISSGTLTENGNGFLTYLVDEDGTDPDAQTQISSMIVGLDATTGVNIFYLYASTPNGGSGETVYATTYRAADSTATLVSASLFAVYIDADGAIHEGVRGDYATYTVVVTTEGNFYFRIDEEAKTFVVLNTAPLVMTKRENNTTDRSTTLTVTGDSVTVEGVERFDAIYADGERELDGYYTYVSVEGVFGYSYAIPVYTFTSDDGTLTFRFLFTSSTSASGSTSYYFLYTAPGEDITVSAYTRMTPEGTEDDTQTITVVITPENTCELVYTTNVGEDAAVAARGAYTTKEVSFGSIGTVVYAIGEDALCFTIVGSSSGSYFRICEPDTFETTYTAAEGTGTLTVNGEIFAAQYSDGENTYVGLFTVVANTFDGEEPAIRLITESGYLYFDLDGTQFHLRGSEAGTYLFYENGSLRDLTITLNGYGDATITALAEEEGGEPSEQAAHYRIDDGACVITSEDGATLYVGMLGAISINNTYYNAFFIRNEQLADAYLNEADLSVLVLDEIGNVTKYDSNGRATYGTYVQLDTRLFYYTSSDNSEAAMYTVSEDGNTVVAADYAQTFYADDFSSIVFYVNGVALFNNDQTIYYVYEDGELYTYAPSEDGQSENDYGFVRRALGLKDGALTYGEKTYRLFEGASIDFTTAEGDKLTFTPSGAATFTVQAQYTPAGEETSTRYVIVDYDEDGQVRVWLARNEQMPISDSSNNYVYTASIPLEISFSEKTFSLAGEETFVLMLYDYLYLQFLSSWGIQFDSFFGYVSVTGTADADGTMTYSVSGSFNFLDGRTPEEVESNAAAEPLTFTDATISRAGYVNSNYGHMFTLEFVGSDGETYHMNFFAAQFTSGIYCYIIYSLTRVTDTLYDFGDGTTITAEEFVYTTGFNIPDGNGEDSYFASGDAYFPAIRYRGEILCTTQVNRTDGEWTFITYAVNGSYMQEYDYIFTFTPGADGSITEGTGSLARRTVGAVTASGSEAAGNMNGSEVRFVYDMDTGEILSVSALNVQGELLAADTCEKVETSDGTIAFVITVDGNSYTVTFRTAEPAEGGTTVTIAGKTYAVEVVRATADTSDEA